MANKIRDAVPDVQNAHQLSQKAVVVAVAHQKKLEEQEGRLRILEEKVPKIGRK